MTYVREGKFPGLTRRRLRELGEELEMSPGIPEFFTATRNHVASIPDYAHEDIDVEHYVVSTGIRPMIEGSPIGSIIDGIWANDFIERPAPPGYLETLAIDSDPHPISMLGYMIDNTSKTRAVFEINKGVNRNAGIDVNALMAEEQRRVPIRNMIYIADGPERCAGVLDSQPPGRQDPRCLHDRAEQQLPPGEAIADARTDPGDGQGRLPGGRGRLPLVDRLT